MGKNTNSIEIVCTGVLTLHSAAVALKKGHVALRNYQVKFSYPWLQERGRLSVHGPALAAIRISAADKHCKGIFHIYPPSKKLRYTKRQLPTVISLNSQQGQRSALFYNTALKRQILLSQPLPMQSWRSALLSLPEGCHGIQLLFCQSCFDLFLDKEYWGWTDSRHKVR